MSTTRGFVAMHKEPTHLRGAALTGLVCAAWIVLAWRSPHLHYHFAPLVAVLLWPVSLRSQGQRNGRDAAIGAAGAAGLVLATTLVITLADKMNGPNFFDSGPVWPEVIIFVAFGAALGFRVASRDRPGFIGGLIDRTA